MPSKRPSIHQRRRLKKITGLVLVSFAAAGIFLGIGLAIRQPQVVSSLLPKIQEVECTQFTQVNNSDTACPQLLLDELATLKGRHWLGVNIPAAANQILRDFGWKVQRYTYHLPNTLRLELIEEPWSYQVKTNDGVWNVAEDGQVLRSLSPITDSAVVQITISPQASDWLPPQPVPTTLQRAMTSYLPFSQQFSSTTPTQLSWEEPHRISGVLGQTPTTIIIDPTEMAVNLERLRLILSDWNPASASASHQLDLRFKLPVLRITP